MRASKKISQITLLATSIITACLISPIALAAQGTITASFHNDCIGNRQIGINAAVSLVSPMLGMGTEYNLNVPEKYNDPFKMLWLDCGQTVNRTLNYDSDYGELNLKTLMVRISYVDNWRSNKQDFGYKTYNFPANGAHCSISYSGMYPPVENISCTPK